MIPNDIREIHCLIPPDFIIQNLNVNNLSVKTHHHRHHEELNVVASGSTSDEAEKRQRRMVSNRESARRSRVRKKRRMDELTSLVVRLRMQNHDLVQRLKHVLESHDRVLQENAMLKEEAAHLRQIVAMALIDFDDPPCNFYP